MSHEVIGRSAYPHRFARCAHTIVRQSLTHVRLNDSIKSGQAHPTSNHFLKTRERNHPPHSTCHGQTWPLLALPSRQARERENQHAQAKHGCHENPHCHFDREHRKDDRYQHTGTQKHTGPEHGGGEAPAVGVPKPVRQRRSDLTRIKGFVRFK